MNYNNLLLFLQTLLPVAEGVASIFIHNPTSAHKFTLVIGEANALEPVAAAVVQTISAAKTATVSA
jgi:hypothetical protein